MKRVVEIREGESQPIVVYRSVFSDEFNWHLEINEARQLYTELGAALAHLTQRAADGWVCTCEVFDDVPCPVHGKVTQQPTRR